MNRMDTGSGPVGPDATRVARYRELLLAYPPAWRRQHGEALLGTLLDVDDARGRTGPTPEEMNDLFIRGLGVRLAYLTPGRSTRELASAAALALGTGLAVVCLVLGEWWAGLDGAYGSRDGRGVAVAWWPFASAAPAYFLLWPLTLVVMLAGRGRRWGHWARWLPVLGVPLAWAVYAAGDRWGLAAAAAWPVVSLAGLGLVAALAGPPRSARHSVRLLAATAAATLMLLLDAVRIIWGGPHPVEGAPVIFPDRPGYHLQMQLFGDALVVIIALLVVAAAVAWWWRRWFPVLLLVGSALTWWILGPVALPGIAVNIGATIIGLQPPAKAPLAEWAVSAVACGVIAVLAIRTRWQYGRPATGRDGEVSHR